jgi:hypothetical protein
MTKKSDEVWETRDGREIPLGDMHAPHIQNAYGVITKWLKGEKDPQQRRDLASWRKRFRKELVKRQREYLERRKADG